MAGNTRFRMPGPGIPPAEVQPALPTPQTDPGPSYNSTQEKVAFVSRQEFPLTSIKRRWKGFDVAITVSKFSGNEITVFCYAIQHGQRVLVASGRYTGGGNPQKVLSVRDFVADGFDITAISNHPPIFPAYVLTSVIASDQTNAIDESLETFGVAEVSPQVTDLAAPILVGSSPLLTPFSGSCVLESAILAPTLAGAAAGLWFQLYRGEDPIPVSGAGATPEFSVQMVGTDGPIDLATMLRGKRWPSGVYILASTSPSTYTAPAASVAWGNVLYR